MYGFSESDPAEEATLEFAGGLKGWDIVFVLGLTKTRIRKQLLTRSQRSTESRGLIQIRTLTPSQKPAQDQELLPSQKSIPIWTLLPGRRLTQGPFPPQSIFQKAQSE